MWFIFGSRSCGRLPVHVFTTAVVIVMIDRCGFDMTLYFDLRVHIRLDSNRRDKNMRVDVDNSSS